jgi:hypothetical protein
MRHECPGATLLLGGGGEIDGVRNLSEEIDIGNRYQVNTAPSLG